MREQRVLADMSIFDVARQSGYSAMAIAGWERGHTTPSVAGLYAYARAVGVTVREVLP